MLHLHATTSEIITQLQDWLRQMDSATYSAKIPVLQGGTLGQHLRHVVEFYTCLSRQQSDGMVDYDARERNSRLETDLDHARRTLRQLDEEVGAWREDRSLSLKVRYGRGEATVVPTSLTRELVYLIEHAVHHMAIIKMAVSQHAPGVRLPPAFGVAHSTRHHRLDTCAS